jgi:RIO kinase 1
VSDYDAYFDDSYEQFEAKFDPMLDRQTRRKRKPKVVHHAKKEQDEIRDEIADLTGLEGGFETTYNPGLFEQGWLLQSLRPFYDMDYISDVLGRVRGGKEASVYRCEATHKAGVELAAAKVYRPRMLRNLRNDKMYREGRRYLKDNGKAIKETDHRMMRAIGKKTRLGAQVEHTSWLMYEYNTLETLYNAGASVPQPLAVSENAVLMGYRGDITIAAPTLNTVTLEDGEAEPLFAEVLRNIEIMLQHGLIHGDLSAYNVLYWDGELTLIDFPQVIEFHSNTNAYMILRRDVVRMCEYFASQGYERDAQALTDELWGAYAFGNAATTAADDIIFAQEEE